MSPVQRGYEGAGAVQERTDVGLLSPEERTERFLEIGRAIEEYGLGKVEWIHPQGGPRDPLFIRSYTHATAQGTLKDERHLAILVQELLSAKFTYEQGLRKFAVEGDPSTATIPPAVLFLERSPQGRMAMWSPETLEGISSNGEAEVLAQYPNMRRASQDESLIVLSQPEGVRNLLLSHSQRGHGAKFRNMLAASLPGDARVTGLENPALMGERDVYYREMNARFQRREELLKAITDAANAQGTYAGDIAYTLDDAPGPTPSTIVIGKSRFTLPEVRRELEYLRASAADRGPKEPMDAKREAYVAQALDAHMAIFGTDHLYNFRKMRNPPRSLGLVWPTIPHFDSGKVVSHARVAEVLLARLSEQKTVGQRQFPEALGRK